MLVEQLRKEWRAREAAGGLREAPCFDADGLVLGARTILAKAGEAEGEIDDGDGRLNALLSVAYGQRTARAALGHVKAATARWCEGDEALAAVHLALSRLGRLDQPMEASRRLFMADGLMRAGVAPEAILEALKLSDATTLKYNPDQPRISAGHGRASGQWTPTGAGGSTGAASDRSQTHPAASASPARVTHPGASTPAPAARAASTRPNPSIAKAPAPARPNTNLASLVVGAASAGRAAASLDLRALSAEALSRLVIFMGGLAESGAVATGVTAAGAVAALGVVFIPSTGPKGQWVHVGGPGDVSYFHNPDETAIQFKYTAADGVQRTFTATPGPGGDYQGPNGRTIARLAKAAGKVGLIVSAAALTAADSDQPKLCPAPVKDRPGGAKGRAYEDFGKAYFNPGNPTPHGMAYAFFDSKSGNMVIIDDCQQKTGILGEYKGPGYAEHIRKRDGVWDGMRGGLLDQAERQVNAAGGRPLTWLFAERGAANAVRAILKPKYEDRIRVICLPWTRNQK